MKITYVKTVEYEEFEIHGVDTQNTFFRRYQYEGWFYIYTHLCFSVSPDQGKILEKLYQDYKNENRNSKKSQKVD